ncbi:hypothetical protein PAMC26577_38770 [Caballeronia sordidicola]|uniref:Uncharacterized protein n=1 Tax=Caballeronia sordidicola TaxID=196367 RepID=A0A242M3G6_CABSO|nr:hypothetical protein PAMC26577_38770 [Caballeronia sordidicola]
MDSRAEKRGFANLANEVLTFALGNALSAKVVREMIASATARAVIAHALRNSKVNCDDG